MSASAPADDGERLGSLRHQGGRRAMGGWGRIMFDVLTGAVAGHTICRWTGIGFDRPLLHAVIVGAAVGFAVFAGQQVRAPNQ